MLINLYLHIYNFKICYFIKDKEAILVLFRQGVSFFTCPWRNFAFFSYKLVFKLHRYELVFSIILCTDV